MLRYYYLGGQRIVMRMGSSTQYWLLTDHLGSTAITANVSGGKSSELRYKAYGETRYTWGTMATDYRFTGQRLDSAVGLYLMGARWYDSSLSRWLSPDSIVLEPGKPQSLNRYSYTRNNPLKYRDPTGHMEDTGEDSGSDLEINWNDPEIAQYYYYLYVNNPHLYEMIMQSNPNDPSILAAQNWAKETGNYAISTWHARKANAESTAEMYRAVDQALPSWDELDQRVNQFDGLFQQYSDHLDQSSEEIRKATVEKVMEFSGSSGIGTSAGRSLWIGTQTAGWVDKVLFLAVGYPALGTALMLRFEVEVGLTWWFLYSDFNLRTNDPNCGIPDSLRW